MPECDASFRLSADAQPSHQIVGSRVDGAPNAYVIEVVFAQQIQFPYGLIRPCSILEPAKDLQWIEPIGYGDQVPEECVPEVLHGTGGSPVDLA
jgi:hypothetical protein